jgi:prolyl oligopeptidase
VKYFKRLIIVFPVLWMIACSQDKLERPPLAPSQLAVDDYFGVKVSDEYRNLENLKDSVVIDWMQHDKNFKCYP